MLPHGLIRVLFSQFQKALFRYAIVAMSGCVLWGSSTNELNKFENSKYGQECTPEYPEPSLGKVQKKDLYIFLLMGQSNMVGRGMLSSMGKDPRILVYSEEGTWRLGVDPLHSTSDRDTVGPGISFAKALLPYLHEEAAIGLVPCAVGGSPLSSWEKDGDLYKRTLVLVGRVIEDGTLKGILWLQGERDAKTMELAESYGERLAVAIHDYRHDLGSHDLPFLAGGLCEAIMEREDRPGAELVSRALKKLPSVVKKTAYVDSSGLSHTGDGVHFSTAAQRILGQRYAEVMAAQLGLKNRKPVDDR